MMTIEPLTHLGAERSLEYEIKRLKLSREILGALATLGKRSLKAFQLFWEQRYSWLGGFSKDSLMDLHPNELEKIKNKLEELKR